MGMVGLFLPRLQGGPARTAEPGVVEVRLVSNYGGGQVFFDPIGVFIEKGQKVRWVSAMTGGSVFAYHPENDNHELRIPENARPFNSGEMPLVRGPHGRWDVFEWTFDVEGTYDYYSRHHEILGMVGRVVVGRPGGPAEKPPGYGNRDGRAVVYPAQVRVFEACPASEIVAKKTIRFPRNLNVVKFPHNA